MTDLRSMAVIAWPLSALGLCFSALITLGGWMLHWSHMSRVRDCRQAFGPEATPIQGVNRGTLCHTGDGVDIARDTDMVGMVEAGMSFFNHWPLWAVALVGTFATIFVVGGVLMLAEHKYERGKNAE